MNIMLLRLAAPAEGQWQRAVWTSPRPRSLQVGVHSIRVQDPRSLILRRSTGTTVSLLQPVNLIRIFHGTSF